MSNDQDTNQTQGDAPAETSKRASREWMFVGVGLSTLMSVMALAIAIVAMADPGTDGTQATASLASMSTMAGATGQAAASTPSVAPQSVKLMVKSDTEHGKRGPDGKWHDAFLPASFAVHAGARVTVTVTNYDQSPHSFTAPTLSSDELINAQIAAGTDSGPRTTTFTFTAPSQPGRYPWWCAIPCDPFAMSHVGYMRGYVTVLA